MKVLLIEDVPNLGEAGEIKKVTNGYARNFLIPQSLAVPATKGALKQAELRHEAETRRQERFEKRAESLAEVISKTTLSFKAKAGESDRLYGSITNADIAQALEREIGEAIDKRRVDLAEPIRELGIHHVPIKLTADLSPKVIVVVEREE